ncbi:MAG: UDP-GlcNAc:undecaprenyl-phosphate/decaprenyl-phosphate GlcNAc-phosphate transferase [Acidobacteriota bacterium]|jgi:UDP-GlcNAc:undecaprenyl-phosphate GlcNAc-1-phosphate transferase|nr:UDP-GlcNAc:undecaprenyl-phosphate/decaprenyl-phosphate GlcNAc-phosphate transferase [Acidobacteriota bacterium]
MNTYIALFSIALFSSLVLTPVIRRLCVRFGWLDVPRDDRRVHTKAIPRVGGLAILLSVVIALLALPLVDNLVTQSLFRDKRQLLMVFVPAILVVLLGLYDDLRGANARLKFLALAVAGTIFYAMGGRVENLSLPIYGSIHLPLVVSYLATLLWIVGVTNAFNLIDGVDGLATGAGLFASLVVLVVSLMLGHPHVTVVALALSGALIGFLRYNFNPASIFLGDSGSLFVGFTLAALSLQGSQKASTAVAIAIPLMAFALPVIDTGFSMARRFLSGKPIFQGDREHVHHMLLARGWSQRRVVFVLYAVCAALGLISLLLVNETSRLTGLILIVVGSAIVLALGRLRYHEVDELKASMRRNLGDRRARAANHLGIRRACRAISKADSLSRLFTAVSEMLELGEFVHASVQLGRGGDSEGNERALERENGSLSLLGVELRKGMIYWSWERGDVKAIDIIGSGRYWSLRLPLSTDHAGWGYINLYRAFDSDALMLDINYLCNLFQREMAQAAERLLSESAQESQARQLAMSASYGD